MTTVIATYTDGSTREMPEAHARILQMRGIATYEPTQPVEGTYLTRDMAHQPAAVVVQKAAVPDPVDHEPENEPEASEESAADDLEAMEKPELHALAKEMGVDVHHNAGAPKVREAIRAKRAEAA